MCEVCCNETWRIVPQCDTLSDWLHRRVTTQSRIIPHNQIWNTTQDRTTQYNTVRYSMMKRMGWATNYTCNAIQYITFPFYRFPPLAHPSSSLARPWITLNSLRYLFFWKHFPRGLGNIIFDFWVLNGPSPEDAHRNDRKSIENNSGWLKQAVDNPEGTPRESKLWDPTRWQKITWENHKVTEASENPRDPQMIRAAGFKSLGNWM